MTLLFDTREPDPHPWAAHLPEGWRIENGTLETGDIALARIPEGRGCRVGGDAPQQGRGGHIERTGWAGFETVHCRDGKTRRFEPGSFPLAHGLPGRVGLLRGYGNAIVPQVAAEFIQAFESTQI